MGSSQMIGGVSFDPEKHIYRHPSTRQRLLSVTGVLKIEGFIDSQWFTDDAKWRGKCVHHGIKLIEKGTIDWDTVDEMIAPYLKAYELFKKETDAKTMFCEQEVWNPNLMFGGMLDWFGAIFGGYGLIDWKTGSIPQWAEYQTAAYESCLPLAAYDKPVKRYGVELKNTGKYSLKPLNDSDSGILFDSMVSLAWTKINNGYVKWEG